MANEIKTVREFYIDTLKILLDYTTEKGFTPKGVVFIPELYQKGQEYTLNWLKNDNFKSGFIPDDVPMYYYNLMALCLCGGMSYADQWEKDYSKIQSGEFDQELFQSGILERAKLLAADVLKLTNDEFMSMIEDLFDKWIDIHKPYWDLQDPRDYTFHLNLAYFQTGVSLYLGQLGY